MTMTPTTTAVAPIRQPYASFTVTVGDDDRNGDVDVALHVALAGIELPPLVVNLTKRDALQALLKLYAAARGSFGL